MLQIVLVVHLLVALAIIGLILLQQGKGAEMGASFGAGASQTLFGSTGSGNALTRATSLLVAIFFATSFGLALMANRAARPTNDLGIEIPAAQVQPAEGQGGEKSAANGDLPVIEDEVPAADGAGGSAPVDEDVPRSQ